MDKKKIMEEVNIYEFFKSLSLNETIKLINSAKNKEEENFYVKVTDYIIQEKQKKIIKEEKY